MDKQTNVRIVTLKDLWQLFVRRLWIIALTAVAVVGVLFLIKTITYTPRYQSTATLYILRQNEGESDVSSSDFSLALNVVNDCTYLLKSHAVLDQVIAQQELDISYEELRDALSTSNPSDTRILEVTVEADSPEEAKALVDSICQFGVVKIADAMGFSQVNLYESGTLDKTPSNQTGLLFYALAGMVTVILTYAVFLLIYLLNDRIQSDEDVERYLGLCILGNIPNSNEGGKSVYGKRSIYGKKSGKSAD